MNKTIKIECALTFHDVYGHQTHHGWQQRAAGCMHCDRPTNTVANQDDGGRSVAVARSDDIGYVAEKGGTINNKIVTGIVVRATIV